MRNLILVALATLSANLLTAQCNELFISEYIEGWSNNKALEIYNPTGSAIDMTDELVCKSLGAKKYSSFMC